VPRNLVVPVLQGRLRGARWIVGSGVHGYWVGCYEWDKRQALERLVSPDAVVFDVGANVGFYTLLASKLVGPKGRVFAFEPLPRNLHYLKRHLAMNRASNVALFEAAVWDRSGIVRFDAGPDASQGRVHADGFDVASVSLDELWAEGSLPLPDVIKMDIEGGELHALRGARQMLERASPTVLLATHGPTVHSGCCELLAELGYRMVPLDRAATLDACDEIIACKAA